MVRPASARAASGAAVTRGEDAAHHGCQVGREEDLGSVPQDLLHFRGVAMRQQPVRREVLVDRSEVQRLLRTAAGAGDARRGIHHDAGGLHQAPACQGREGQPRRGGVAPRRGHERRTAQAVPEQFGEAVHRRAQQFGRCVLLAVPARIERSVVQPEVGGEVDDEPDPAPQIGDEALGLAVGQRTEHEVEPVETGGIAVLVDEAGVRRREGRRVLPHRLAGMGVRGGHGHLESRMARQQAQQLGTRVARRPDDPCLHRISIHKFAYSCELG